MKNSRESYEDRLRQLEHIQISKELSKVEERDLNNEINLLKRKIKDAVNTGNIEMKLEQALELKEELDETI